jgi:hypothetical protein
LIFRERVVNLPKAVALRAARVKEVENCILKLMMMLFEKNNVLLKQKPAQQYYSEVKV